jgi:hypothetical protein
MVVDARLFLFLTSVIYFTSLVGVRSEVSQSLEKEDARYKVRNFLGREGFS